MPTISSLPAGSTITGSEIVPFVQSGINVKYTSQDLKTFASTRTVRNLVGTSALTQADNGCILLNNDPLNFAVLTIANNALDSNFSCIIANEMAGAYQALGGGVNITPASATRTADTNTVNGLPFYQLAPGCTARLDKVGKNFLLTPMYQRQPIRYSSTQSTFLSPFDGYMTQIITYSGASYVQIPIETSSFFFPEGFWIKYVQGGAGQLNFQVQSGSTATIISTNNAFKTFTQNSPVWLTKLRTDVWQLEGDTTI